MDVSAADWQSSPATPLNVAELIELLASGTEHVIVDVREEGVFACGHLFHAASLPLSRLELRVRAMVPRFGTPLVLTADDESDTQRAVAVLARAGYTDLRVLVGGNRGWVAAGQQLFSGIHVPSKAFGEVVEHANHTPRVSPDDVESARNAGVARLHVDSRPLSEFSEFTLPGAADCPGAELLLRAPAAAAGRPIVVNCAGRTRSIIGAQSLINAGIPAVAALENGTMGWHLIGQALERGATRLLPVPDTAAVATARARATRLARQLGVRWLDAAGLAVLRADRNRSTYCLDVRLPEDYVAGHLPGFLSAPGGQLVQSTDLYAPVRNARVVLFDTLGVQAPMTAHWLVQMGVETWVLDLGAQADAALTEHGAAPCTPAVPVPEQHAIDVGTLQRLHASGSALLVDVDDSRAYRRGHLPGACWLTRARVAAKLPDVLAARFAGASSQAAACVFVAADPALAAFACADAKAAGLSAVWLEVPSRVAQATLGTSTAPDFLCPTDDAWYSPYQLEEGVEAAMRDYIQWETGLLERLADEPGVRFCVHVAEPSPS